MSHAYVPYGTYVRTRYLKNDVHVYNLKNNLKYKHSGATGTLASGRCQHSKYVPYGIAIRTYVRTYNVMSQLSDWKRAHMCTENHVCVGRVHGSQLREGANAGTYVRTYTYTNGTNGTKYTMVLEYVLFFFWYHGTPW